MNTDRQLGYGKRQRQLADFEGGESLWG